MGLLPQGYSKKLVTEWVLDADQFRGELRVLKRAMDKEKRQEKDLAAVRDALKKETKQLTAATDKLGTETSELDKKTKQMGDSSKKLFSTFSDYKHGFDMIVGAGKKLYDVLDSTMTQTAKYDNLLKNNTLNIDKARDATQGYISKIDLLQSANMATAFDLGLTSDQFAKLAQGAVIAAQKIGGDVNNSIRDLMTGMARQSKMILDNLGIQVDMNDAQDKYAESLGKTAKELTDVEKKQAFMAATIADLDRITADATLTINSSADSWVVMKNNLSDAVVELGSAITKSSMFKDIIDQWTYGFKELSRWITGSAAATRQLRVEQEALSQQKATDKLIMEGLHDLGKPRKEKKTKGKKSSTGKAFEVDQGAYAWSPGVATQTEDDDVIADEKFMKRLDDFKEYTAVADEFDKIIGSMDDGLGKARVELTSWVDELSIVKDWEATMEGFAKTGLQAVVQGFVDLGAVVASGELSAGAAAKRLVSVVLQSLADECTGRAMFASTMAVEKAVRKDWADAAAEAGLAVAWTAAAVALGALSGSMASSAKGRSSAARSQAPTGGYVPDYGKPTGKDQPINVNVYIGDPEDPGAISYGMQKLKVQINEAA